MTLESFLLAIFDRSNCLVAIAVTDVRVMHLDIIIVSIYNSKVFDCLVCGETILPLYFWLLVLRTGQVLDCGLGSDHQVHLGIDVGVSVLVLQ